MTPFLALLAIESYVHVVLHVYTRASMKVILPTVPEDPDMSRSMLYSMSIHTVAHIYVIDVLQHCSIDTAHHQYCRLVL